MLYGVSLWKYGSPIWIGYLAKSPKDHFSFYIPSTSIPSAQCHVQAYDKFWGSNLIPHLVRQVRYKPELSPSNPSTRFVKIRNLVFKIPLKNIKDTKGWKIKNTNLVYQKRKECEGENERGSAKFASQAHFQSHKMLLVETHTNLLILSDYCGKRTEQVWVKFCYKSHFISRRVIQWLHFRKEMSSL